MRKIPAHNPGRTRFLLIPPPLGAHTLLNVHYIPALAALNSRYLSATMPRGLGAGISIDNDA